MGYVSELTAFWKEFLAKHPEERHKARLGRATWWDRPQDAALAAAFAEARVPATPYAYDPGAPIEPHRAGGYRPLCLKSGERATS